jgi:antitoxin (DNA-binding transcriptional repressor) of toxin-antitoxin stability system
MEFITVRDLRTRPGQIWDKLRQQRDLILTSNGRPIAVLSHIDEGGVEETLAVLRRARAQAALSRLRAEAAAQGLDRLSADEIEAEITAARTERRGSGHRASAPGAPPS